MSEESGALSVEKPESNSEIIYPMKSGRAIFSRKFSADTELSGYMSIRLWVDARPDLEEQAAPDDMVLFVSINKLDQDGKAVYFNGWIGITWDMITRGWCKVSRDKLDPDQSTERHPVQSGTTQQKLKAGEIVPVDIELYPSSTYFTAGEALQLIIVGKEIIPSPPYKKSRDCNHGKHVLHFGGYWSEGEQERLTENNHQKTYFLSEAKSIT